MADYVGMRGQTGIFDFTAHTVPKTLSMVPGP